MAFNLLFGKMNYETRTVKFKNRKFRLQVADSFGKLSTGLMKHERIGTSQGMMLVFGSVGRHAIWMLNMKFSIDVIWLDESGRVLHIWEEAVPCASILACRAEDPEVDSKYVIELRAGTAERLKLRIGDRFTL